MLLDNLERTNLLAGLPVHFNSLTIYQPTLKDINVIGHNRFSRYVNLLTISESDLLFMYHKNKIENGISTPILWLYQNSILENSFFLELKMAFFTYLKKEVILDPFRKGFKIPITQEDIPTIFKSKDKTQKYFFLTESNFSDFQSIIRALNMMEKEEDDEIVTDNLEMKKKFEEARKRLKLAKAKERAEKSAKNNGKEIEFADIVSSLCAYGVGYTIFNVRDLTLYQLYDQFNRLQAKSNYEMGTQMILAGADKKKIDLQYWIKKNSL